MTLEELQNAWVEYKPQVAAEYEEWDERRLAAIPEYLSVMDAFLAGDTDVRELRSRIDSLGKSHPVFGFGGMSQMFFNQLVNAAEPEALDTALKATLPVPAEDREGHEKLEQFCSAVEASRENASSLGVTQPGVGRVDAFVSFFWELQDRDQWPRFFPNSRDLLEQHGLLDTNQGQPELYLAYRTALAELKDRLGVDTWTLEHLLWHLGDGGKVQDPLKGPDKEAVDSDDDAASNDLYASYRAQGLHFPDEVVTSLVLSLATKRFVILSGISGTGKTRIALGLAEHLEQGAEAAPEIEPPRQDASNLYVRLTAPKIRRGFVRLGLETRDHFESALGLPERGSSRLYETGLPDGTTHKMRLNNVGFADATKELYRLYLRKDIAEWVQANAKPGDFLHLKLGTSGGAGIELGLVGGSSGAPEASADRHATIAVRSDWTDPRGLIGYFNPLTSSYVRTELIDLLMRAGDDPGNPYVAILDEMNLARVEYYFSDFLSALESGEPLRLMDPGEADESAAGEGPDVELPAELEIPANVSFIGTVNVDETTHPFSPKVLDRANVLEFNEVDVERALGHGDKSSAPGLRLAGGFLDPSWLCTERDAALSPQSLAHETDAFTGALEDVHGLLALYNLHFGYRVIGEISAFVGHALEKTDGDSAEITRLAFDLQLRQKIIPKLSGGRELEEPLARLLDYCLDGQRKATVEVEAVRAAARERLDPASATSAPKYPGSARKLLRMLDRVAEAGFVGALE